MKEREDNGSAIQKIRTDRKVLTCVCFIFFVICRIALMIHYKGWYAFDETYHISSADNAFYFTSEYSRAAFINTIIHWLSNMIGRSYYVYKLIPFCLSIISVGALLYVLYHMASHTYSVLLYTVIICFHGIVIYNHLYIREYIWDEAVISLLVLLLYRMCRARELYKKICIYFLYFILATGLAILQSGYWIALAVAVFGIMALIVNSISKRYLQKLRNFKYIWVISSLVIFSFVILEIVLIAYRTGAINLPFPGFISGMMNHYGYWGYPYFTRNFYKGGIGLVIGVVIYGCHLLKKEEDDSDNNIGIYFLGIVPFILFNMIWFDCFPMRIYASYLPVFILIAVLGFDTLPDRIYYKCFMVLSSIIVILKPQAETDLIEYIRAPYIWNETNFNDYGGLIMETRKAMDEGRKCICIWSNEHEKAAFAMDAEYTIALADSVNVLNGYTKEDFYALLNYLQNTEEPYVLMIGTHCDWKLDDISEDFLDILFSEYPYSEYERRAYLFYIN